MTLKEKILSIQHRLLSVKWDKESNGEYSFIPEWKVKNEITPLLVEYRVIMLPPQVISTSDGNVTVGFSLKDVDSDEEFSGTIIGFSNDGNLYKAYTGALKYFYFLTFNIPTSDDIEKNPDRVAKLIKPVAPLSSLELLNLNTNPIEIQKSETKDPVSAYDIVKDMDDETVIKQLSLKGFDDQKIKEFMGCERVTKNIRRKCLYQLMSA